MYDVVHLPLYMGWKALHRHCIPRRVSLGLSANVRHTVLFDRMAREGVKATMIPSFPSKTFPNHYTPLLRGWCPDHHGIVANLLGPTASGALQDEQSENPQRCVLLWRRTYLDYRTETGHQDGKHLLGRL